jgi:hypothetical protein
MSATVASLGSAPYAAAVGVAVVFYFVIYPFILYLNDTKGKISYLKRKLQHSHTDSIQVFDASLTCPHSPACLTFPS